MGVVQLITNQIVPGKYKIVNFLCLITKQYIYAKKCLGKFVHFTGIVQKFKLVQSMEKYIAIKNDRLSYHSKKWGVGDTEFSTQQYVDVYFM